MHCIVYVCSVNLQDTGDTGVESQGLLAEIQDQHEESQGAGLAAESSVLNVDAESNQEKNSKSSLLLDEEATGKDASL